MSRDREYRVETTSVNNEQFIMITDSRDRALHFAGMFMKKPELYSYVAVQVDGRTWVGSRIGGIP